MTLVETLMSLGQNKELIWHVIFGAAPVLPRREEDPMLSTILRFTLDDATSLPLPDHSMLLHWQAPRKSRVFLIIL